MSIGEYMRRSLTITPENDKKIQLARGLFLNDPEEPVDVDYTTMVNFLVELGHKLFYSLKKDYPQVIVDRKEVNSILSKYILESDLKDEAVVDQFTDVFYKRLLQQMQTIEAEHQKSLPQSACEASNSADNKSSSEYVS
jgi:hypothetical protein